MAASKKKHGPLFWIMSIIGGALVGQRARRWRYIGLCLLLAAGPAAADWVYRNTADPMTSKVTLTARSISSNQFELAAPYAGTQHAMLILRKHPRHGLDVMLGIQKGQFNCSAGRDCSILVRFDARPAMRFNASRPADHSSDMIFIENFHRFYGEVMKSKRMLIEVAFFSNGNRQLEFDIAGLDPKFFSIAAAAKPRAAKPRAPEMRSSGKSADDCEAEIGNASGREREAKMAACLLVPAASQRQ